MKINSAFHRTQTFGECIHLFPLLFTANTQSCSTEDQEEDREASIGHTPAAPGGAVGTSGYCTTSQLLAMSEIFTTRTQQGTFIKPSGNRSMSSRDL